MFSSLLCSGFHQHHKIKAALQFPSLALCRYRDSDKHSDKINESHVTKWEKLIKAFPGKFFVPRWEAPSIYQFFMTWFLSRFLLDMPSLNWTGVPDWTLQSLSSHQWPRHSQVTFRDPPGGSGVHSFSHAAYSGYQADDLWRSSSIRSGKMDAQEHISHCWCTWKVGLVEPRPLLVEQCHCHDVCENFRLSFAACFSQMLLV